MKTICVLQLLLASLLVASATTCGHRWGSGCHGGDDNPLFRGTDGRSFYFDGTNNTIFNLLSEQDHQLNALFSEEIPKDSSLGQETIGTYMTAFGLKAYENKVNMTINEEGQVTVMLNGKVPELTDKNTFTATKSLSDGVTVKAEQDQEALGYRVTVTTPMYQFILYPTAPAWSEELNHMVPSHLNLELSVNVDAQVHSSVHGVLGQASTERASDTSLVPEELTTMFLGEGEHADYIVSSLFADDFKFNKYNAAPASEALTAGITDPAQLSRKQAVSRRRDLRESAPRFFSLFKLTGAM